MESDGFSRRWPATAEAIALRTSVSGAPRVQQKLKRIKNSPVCPHFVVQMRARGATGRSHQSEQVAAFHLLSDLDFECRQVAVARLEAVAMLHDHEVAVVAG